MATAAAGNIAMLLGSICAIKALRRRAYSDLGIWIIGRQVPVLERSRSWLDRPAVTGVAGDEQSVQRRFRRGCFGLVAFGEQQQRRDTQVFHDFHVIAFAVFGL